MVRLTKISSGTREAIELPRANQVCCARITAALSPAPPAPPAGLASAHAALLRMHSLVQRSFAFIEGKTAGVAVKGLCGKTWRAAAQWCNTVGCSGW